MVMIYFFVVFKYLDWIGLFSDVGNNYLADWTQQFDEVKLFSWISLRIKPTWSEVNASLAKIAECDENIDLNKISSKVWIHEGLLQ